MPLNIFVTGGAGFIGSHVVKALLQNRHRVTVFDNLSTGCGETIPQGVTFIRGDITDITSVTQALEVELPFDAVIHMAGKIIVPESVANPMLYYDQNIAGGMNLIEVMRKKGIPKLIFSSSAAVYGHPQRIPILEDDPKIPTSPYGATKIAFEMMMSAYAQSYGMSCISLRYFNAYGVEEHHKPETHAIPNFIQAILKNEPIILTGSDEQVRDFVYIDDIARAHVEALQLNGLHTLNLGSGSGVTLKDLINTLEKISNREVRIHKAAPRPGDPKELVADATKIKKLLGWTPRVNLEEGLKRTWEYYRDRNS